MSVNRIVILKVNPEHNADYIANVFWEQDIGKVSSITLIPQIYNQVISNIAYIYFHSFCDSEAAYKFIDSMKCDSFVFCHNPNSNENNLWVLQKNTHHSGELLVGEFTKIFTPSGFEYFDAVHFEEETVIEEIRPHQIVGLDSKPYYIEEALQHLWYLEEKYFNSYCIEDLLDEIYHFELQIALYYFSRGNTNIILSDFLLSHGIQVEDCKITRLVGQSKKEYDDMEKFIEYCKPRANVMRQMINPTGITREFRDGYNEFLPPPISPISIADKEIL